jgi:DNA-binding CsgD family transcriptional regulator
LTTRSLSMSLSRDEARTGRNLDAITSRQLECLRWAGEGKSASDIGVILGISARTVEGHIARTCALLGVRTRIQAVVLAKDLGLLVRGAP